MEELTYSKALGRAFAARRQMLGMTCKDMADRVNEAWGASLNDRDWSAIERCTTRREITDERLGAVCEILQWEKKTAVKAAELLSIEE